MSTAVSVKFEVQIPLRDGVNLSAILYLPSEHAQPTPTIVTLTPYTAQLFHDRGMYFASHGYPFLAVDVRGRGNSDGEFRPMIQEARDGYDVIEWTAAQHYCNGQVAMWGGSYGGYAQWATAKERPPHLATIVPAAAAYPGVDFPMWNNVWSPYAIQWLTLVSGKTLQDRLFWGSERFWRERFRGWFVSHDSFRSIGATLGTHLSSAFNEWLNHPHPDSYWDRFNPTRSDYAKLTLPTLTITGIYDADQPGALKHFQEYLAHSSPQTREHQYLIVGPWDHAGTRAPQLKFCGIEVEPQAVIDVGRLHLEWYAWIMRQGPKPAFLKRNVAYYLMAAERWCYADSLESITAAYDYLYLDSPGSASHTFASGSLGGLPGSGDPDEYIYDPSDVYAAESEAASLDPVSLRPPFPQDNVRDDSQNFVREGKQLYYHSAPFEHDTEISGFFELSVWLAIDQPDTDFRVTVFEVLVDGTSIMLATDSMRARFREDLREPRLIQTTQPLKYEFNRFTFVSRLVRAGSHLRLVFGPIDSIFFEKNHNSGGVVSDETGSDARAVRVRLFHDGTRPSALYVPLGNGGVEDHGFS